MTTRVCELEKGINTAAQLLVATQHQVNDVGRLEVGVTDAAQLDGQSQHDVISLGEYEALVSTTLLQTTQQAVVVVFG